MMGKHHLYYAVTASATYAALLGRQVSTLHGHGRISASVATSLAAFGTGWGPIHYPAVTWSAPHALWLIGAGAVGGLLPDLDEPGSMISNAPRILGKQARHLLSYLSIGPLRPIVWLVGLILLVVAGLLNVLTRASSHVFRFLAMGHREGSHWLPVWIALCVGVYLLTAPVAGPAPAVGFGLGYLTHLLTDALTKTGIPLIPKTGLRLHLLPRPMRIRTGGIAENWFTGLYVLAAGALVAGAFVA